jgi:uncharacterized protein (UPF0548 family)
MTDAKAVRRRTCMDHASDVAKSLHHHDNEIAWVAAYTSYHANHFKEFEQADLPHWEATKTWNLVHWQGSTHQSEGNTFIVNLLERFAPQKDASAATDADYQLFIASLRVISSNSIDLSELTALFSGTLKSHVCRGQRLFETRAMADQMASLKLIIQAHDAGNLQTHSQVNELLSAVIAGAPSTASVTS